MNNTDYTVIQVLQGMQETLWDVQETLLALQKGQEALQKEQNLGGAIPRSVLNIKDITLVHIYRMVSRDLGVELDKKTKAIINTCTRLVCNELASIPSIHACLLGNNGIDFTRCHKNWASVAKVSQLQKNRKKQQ
ncbi:hypothetical protein PHYBLDRAFT_151889 [Phycomyces blakesleeanus NRRL 1555(-)]|uniref:Uncharacterized protein n=1 Tax=Phycomyces blakesleeanus (strain ATCC 8743b / DSM 1359 / FGSC 10004 / NBRC 33097 / NRRL 1555) TaxID=763407 RepID=A0A162ZI79_PHYB8|nr:hypothetical protein PHYBLDRAFT_151889 [Phycomyces blakesleeanus NRRL 1555(-)]OAD66951.1 hypothetical protein PHYBLDRAFT_151889 [Phycomyces blakesleeanus NRRL 1555(-)]|eukprot:XP_018284991.1 hypothetical protein PHYBLDRAFT_151889 [Phycomyces blakesleeanus NRRL 1555(-)]